MKLTYEKYERVARAAREDLKDVLKLIADHEAKLAEGKRAAYLNPYIALGSVVAWERFALDLVGAATQDGWKNPGDDKGQRERQRQLCWPDPADPYERRARRHLIDAELQRAGVLDGPLTAHWRCWVATSWRGKAPTRWVYVDYAAEPAADNAELLQAAMLSAKSARDAAAHGLFHKKAADAQKRGHYWWYGDNHEKGGAPTIQNGYARGVAALFLQLVDASLVAVGERNGWTDRSLRLPPEWFAKERTKGTFTGVDFWADESLR